MKNFAVFRQIHEYGTVRVGARLSIWTTQETAHYLAASGCCGPDVMVCRRDEIDS